ncbi:MAG: hypothetical protein AAFN42_04020 [Cyanobacteria bacterium J06554_1]
MPSKNSHPIQNYTLAGLGGAGALALIQNLGKNILPALASALVSLWNSLTGGSPVIFGCGIYMPGNHNDGDHTVYCDEVNHHTLKTLFLDLEIEQTYEWKQIIENSLNLDIELDNTVTENSILYDILQILEISETPYRPHESCFLPHTPSPQEPDDWDFEAIDWTFEEVDPKKKLQS